MFSRIVAVCVSGLLLPVVTAAQARPIELGFDSRFEIDFNGTTVTSLSVPVGAVRAGFFVSDNVSVEPRLDFLWVKAEESDAVYALDFGVSGLYHFESDPARARPYLRAQGGIQLVGGGGESASQFNVAGGLGVKIPIIGQLAARLEAAFAHGFENDDFEGRNAVAALFGFSMFTR